MTNDRTGGLPVLRLTLAAIVVVDLVSFLLFIGEARAAALGRGATLAAFAALLSHPIASGLVGALGVAGAVAFARRPGRLWAGVIALVALALLSAVHGQLFGSPWRHLYFSGVCLTGWLAGLVVTRSHAAPHDESYARVGAIALLGAAYFNSGVSKLVYGGLDWLSGTPVQAAIVAQDGLVADGILAYVRLLATTPPVAMLLSVATVGLELSGPLMLVGRWARVLVALGLFAMHLNIWVLTGVIVYWESMVLLLVFGLSADQPLRASAVTRRAWFVPAAVLLALSAVIAISHQLWRFSHTREITIIPPTVPYLPEPTPEPPPTPPPLESPHPAIGPFRVGDTLAGWSIDSLHLRKDGFVATLSGEPGRVGLIVTCALPDVRGLFDLEEARILYASDLDPSRFRDVGMAFRERIRIAAEGQDVCDVVASWHAAAMAGGKD